MKKSINKIHYIALLRSINVGGKNVIKMSDLKACFEKIGFKDVSTYIQSVNVLFWSEENAKINLLKRLKKS